MNPPQPGEQPKLQRAELIWNSAGEAVIRAGDKTLGFHHLEVVSIAHRFPQSLRVELKPTQVSAAQGLRDVSFWLLAVPLWMLRVEVEPILPTLETLTEAPLFMMGDETRRRCEESSWSDAGPLRVRRLLPRLYQLSLYKKGDFLFVAHAARLRCVYRRKDRERG